MNVKVMAITTATLAVMSACGSVTSAGTASNSEVVESPTAQTAQQTTSVGVQIAVTNDVEVTLDAEGFIDQRVTEELYVLYPDGTATENLANAHTMATSSELTWQIGDQLVVHSPDGGTNTFDNFSLVEPATVGATYEGCWEHGDVQPGIRISSKYCFDHSGNLAADRLNAATDGEPAEAVAGEQVIRAGTYAVNGLSVTFTFESGDTETRGFVPINEDGEFKVMILDGVRYLKTDAQARQ